MSEDVDAHIIDKYEISKRLGKGAYGIVWKAVDRRTRDTIALKKIFDAFRNQTDAQRTFREIMFLQEFGRHPNIIKLFNILKADNDRDIYLVFEYMDADLHNVIKKQTILKDIHKQYIMCQLFRAVRFLHSGNVLHRDLKPSNVLLDADCRVKLADFGLARSLSQLEDYPEGQNLPELTEYVATRWYRAPEILLAAKRYTKGVDMWSLGCILGEMLIGHALFPGTSTINQIERIMNSIARPNKVDIESIGSHYAASVLDKMVQRPRKPLETLITSPPPNAMDLIFRLLIFAPHKRLTVEQCLMHPYVYQFHNSADEPALNYEVTLSLSDHVQLGIDEYRTKLYEMIAHKKTHIRRIQHNEQQHPKSNNVTTVAPVNKPTTYDSRRPVTINHQQHPANDHGRGVVIHRPHQHLKAPAPIAEAECSDTDYDTARSVNGGRRMSAKVNDTSTTLLATSATGVLSSNRDRAQSADSANGKSLLQTAATSALRAATSKVRIDKTSNGCSNNNQPTINTKHHHRALFGSFRPQPATNQHSSTTHIRQY